MSARTIAARVALIAGLVGLSVGLAAGRRGFIRQFFVDGAVPHDAPVWTTSRIGDGVPAAARVRVVLLDGLGAAYAEGLPQLSRLCLAGQELRVDVGFPTVSLPVQTVLWTGLTQQQSGLQYHIGKLDRPPRGAVPPQVDSVAVAESHPEIVHSFGFTRAEPPDAPVTDEWRQTGFAAAALAAVASDAELVFVHVLRVDEAGHAHGAASQVYADVAAWSDELLGRLVQADADLNREPRTLWLVLADHGHRAAGGHGGAEPEIRIVRACLAGPGIHVGELRMIHLVDVARALADALGVRRHPDATGRPWQVALADPVRGATLPRPGPTRWLISALIFVAGLLSLRPGLGGHARWDRLTRWLGPPLIGPRWLAPALGLGWVALGVLGVALYCGWPTLSNPAVYPPLGRDLLYGSAPGLIALVAVAATATRRYGCSGVAVVRAALVPGAAWIAATLVMCREPDALLFGTPPLMPWTTGLASVLLVQGRAACLLLALFLAVRLLLRHRALRRARRAATAPPQPSPPQPSPPQPSLPQPPVTRPPSTPG